MVTVRADKAGRQWWQSEQTKQGDSGDSQCRQSRVTVVAVRADKAGRQWWQSEQTKQGDSGDSQSRQSRVTVVLSTVYSGSCLRCIFFSAACWCVFSPASSVSLCTVRCKQRDLQQISTSLVYSNSLPVWYLATPYQSGI